MKNDLVSFGDNVIEDLAINCHIVSLLVKAQTEDGLNFHFSWLVVGIHLRISNNYKLKFYYNTTTDADYIQRGLQWDIFLPNYKNGGHKLILTCKTQYPPFFFFFNNSIASAVYPGAMIPSETSLEIILAVWASQMSLKATKSPKLDILSAPLALA